MRAIPAQSASALRVVPRSCATCTSDSATRPAVTIATAGFHLSARIPTAMSIANAGAVYARYRGEYSGDVSVDP
jgi:hypothetical protein